MAQASKSVKDPFRFNRSDQVAFVVVLVFASAIAFVTLILEPLRRWINDDPIPVSFNDNAAIAKFDALKLRYSQVSTAVDVPTSDSAARLWDLAPGVLFTGCTVIGALLLALVTRDIAGGRAFLPRNVNRLRILSSLILMGSIATEILRSLADSKIVDAAQLGDTLNPGGFSINISLIPVAVALVLALIAEAFAAGSRMRDDLEGVI